MPTRCQIINPNTSTTVTQLVLDACRKAQPHIVWEGSTARFGTAYIANEVGYAKAAHATLDAYETGYGGQDAILLACFGDPGLLALRELAQVPVVGLAQASFQAAAQRGRFAVVTGGRRWTDMLTRFARAHRLDDALVAIHAIELSGAQIAANPAQALDHLIGAAQEGVAAGAQSILLGGAALTGLAPLLQTRIGVPVLDNVQLAAQAVSDAVGTFQPRNDADTAR